MKRIFAILVSVSMLLSLGALVASAGDFVAPVGEVEMTWLTDEQVAEIAFDGEIGEWVDFGLNYYTITRDNLVVWHKDNVPNFNPDTAIDEDFSINAYLAADADYLYVAFFIKGDNFALSDNPAAYNGDAFQISVDWNTHMEQALSGGADYSNNKNVFYSFACLEEGGDLQINVQEGFKDRIITEDTAENPDKPEMKGSAGSYEGGWCAEFCLSWELLYGDFEYKTWDATQDLFDADHPLKLGLTVCYINREETNGEISWAAGTFRDDEKFYDHTPLGNGMYAVLNWEEGRVLNCAGILPAGTIIEKPTETVSDTEAPVESEEVVTTAVAETEVVTEAIAETEAATTAATEAATTTVATEEAGCKSVVGTAGALALVAALAAGVVIRKKD